MNYIYLRLPDTMSNFDVCFYCYGNLLPFQLADIVQLRFSVLCGELIFCSATYRIQ